VAVVREVAGRAGAPVLSALATGISRHTAVRLLLGLALQPRPVPFAAQPCQRPGGARCDVVHGTGQADRIGIIGQQ
jgi:hypothetical protein